MDIHVVIVCSMLHLLPFGDCLKCTGNTYYRVKKNGKGSCKDCEPCIGGGIGWNEKFRGRVQRLDDELGFLSCLPCEKCAEGTYRKLVSRDSWCRACALDCTRLKRYWSVKCGGDNEGHCSECLHGYATASKEPNSMCTRSRVKSTKDPKMNVTAYGPKHHLQSTENPQPKPAIRESYQQRPSNFHDNFAVWTPGLVLLLLVVGTLICAVVAARKGATKNRKCTDLEVDSKHALLISNGTSIGECNDLETDGGGNQPNKARGELPTDISIDELEAIDNRRDTVHPKVVIKEKRKYRNRPLHKDNVTLSLVACKVSGERRHELFQTYLKIEKAKTDPEQEMWSNGVISLPDYILNVLKIWLQIYGEDADLQTLILGLKMANFTNVIAGILDLPENRMPPEDNTKGIKIVEIEINTTDYGIISPIFPEEEENRNEMGLISLYSPPSRTLTDGGS